LLLILTDHVPFQPLFVNQERSIVILDPPSAVVIKTKPVAFPLSGIEGGQPILQARVKFEPAKAPESVALERTNTEHFEPAVKSRP
jgi:hypothetical protein